MAATSSQTSALKMLLETSVHSTTLLEAKLIPRKAPEETAPDASIIIFTVGLVLAIVAMLLILTAFMWRPKKEVARFHPSPIPCRHCWFFKENQYLKCAVQPKIVLTQQAIDCQDYQPCQ